jgi:O-antigen ligase
VLPLFAPVLVIGLLLLPTAAPDVLPTLQDRITGTSSQDANLIFRERAREAALEGVADEWLTGVGFGRVNRFQMERKVVTIGDDPHNSYAYLLAGGGVLALGAFVFLCVLYVLDAVTRLRHADPVGQALVVWAVGTWFVFMVNAATGPVLPHTIMLLTIWVLFALPSVVPRSSPALDG